MLFRTSTVRALLCYGYRRINALPAASTNHQTLVANSLFTGTLIMAQPPTSCMPLLQEDRDVLAHVCRRGTRAFRRAQARHSRVLTRAGTSLACAGARQPRAPAHVSDACAGTRKCRAYRRGLAEGLDVVDLAAEEEVVEEDFLGRGGLGFRGGNQGQGKKIKLDA